MRKLAIALVLLSLTGMTLKAEWTRTNIDGGSIRWVYSSDQDARLMLRTSLTGADIYVDFRQPFGEGERLHPDDFKTVWVFVWFDGQKFRTQDWPTGTDGRSMFVPKDWLARYSDKIHDSKTMTVEVLRPLDSKLLKYSFDLR